MALEGLTLQLVLVFLPGILCALLVEQLTVHQPWDSFRFALYAFVLGVACHLLWGAGFEIAQGRWPESIWFLDAVADGTEKNRPISYYHVLGATISALPLAAVLSFALNDKWLHRVAHRLNVSKRFGDMDVWGYMLNARDLSDWVVVRDLDHDLAYEGWVQAFSDSTDPDELLLLDAVVYRNSTWEELYKLKAVYIAREKKSVTVEFRHLDGAGAAPTQGEQRATEQSTDAAPQGAPGTPS